MIHSACSACRCPNIAHIKSVSLEIVCDAKISWGNVMHPTTDLYVCVQCGALRWQLTDHVAFLADIKHDVIDTAASAYR